MFRSGVVFPDRGRPISTATPATRETAMFDDTITHEAHAFMSARALRAVPAIDAIADPIARAWCRSFGVAGHAAAVERLRSLLGDRAVDLLSSGAIVDDLQARLDSEAEAIIFDWFGQVVGAPLPRTTQGRAILRLAFLEANGDARWSDAFLADDVAIMELAADLDASMIVPTPVATPRAMPRQSL